MKLRSPALAVLGVLLMAAAAVLGAILVHDGEVAATADLAHADPGEELSVKGTPQPFHATAASRAWRAILPVLDNHTYTLDDPREGVVLLLTSPAPAPEGVVLAEGKVLQVAPHPDGSGRLVVVLGVREWREPILFR